MEKTMTRERKAALDFRPITYEDTANIIKWRNNPAVKENYVIRDDLDEATHLNWMKTRVETGEVIQYIIRYVSRDVDIGSAMLLNVDREKGSAETGAFIGEDEYLGKGLGFELGKKLIQIGFEELDLKYLYCRVLKENTSTIRFNEVIGYKKIDNPQDYGIRDAENESVVFLLIKNPNL
jgi:RimJ/RimL family protein N-acetyltransferase